MKLLEIQSVPNSFVVIAFVNKTLLKDGDRTPNISSPVADILYEFTNGTYDQIVIHPYDKTFNEDGKYYEVIEIVSHYGGSQYITEEVELGSGILHGKNVEKVIMDFYCALENE